MHPLPLYVAIDLGSNSFHMLVARAVEGSIQTVDKIKRKVRLASGLDADNYLSHEAMHRGWHCLSLFAERLQDIEPQHIRVVGTATLRTAINIKEFVEKAEEILGHNIEIISGEQEAQTIYQGVAHTSGGGKNRLVVDIGGASTEVIIGESFDAKVLKSFKVGCVTWLNRYFQEGILSKDNFTAAIDAAKKAFSPYVKEYTAFDWDVCVGASGTVQALQEIMLAQGMDEVITLKKLQRMQRQALKYTHITELDIKGLTMERALVFPSGLAILIALFELFDIHSMRLAGGALREGILYDMIPDMKHTDIQARTLKSMQHRFYLDTEFGNMLSHFCQSLLAQCPDDWLKEDSAPVLLNAAAVLHELGKCISYKEDGAHAAYMITHLDLPGFTSAQQKLLAELLMQYRDQLSDMPKQYALSDLSAKRILQLLRIAVILCHRRDPSKIPDVKLLASDEHDIEIIFPKGWLLNNPLMEANLKEEADKQMDIGWNLTFKN